MNICYEHIETGYNVDIDYELIEYYIEIDYNKEIDYNLNFQ